MSLSSLSGRPDAAPAARSKALRRWLATLSFLALAVTCGAMVMGLLVMVGFRLFAWAGISILILLLAAGTVGAWVAYRKGRNRSSFELSLLAAVPILLLMVGVASIYFGKNP
jgi:uncharacterized SAM-binding protein YcdF (DUF218 family)